MADVNDMLATRMCERAWPAGAGVHGDTYRQHRCRRTDAHRDCICRYCGAHRQGGGA